MSGRKLFRISLIISCLFSINAFGQSDSLRYRIIESFSKDLCKYYVSESLAIQMADSIRQKYKVGGYSPKLNIDEFAYEIAKDVRRISGDNHLTILPSHSDYLNLDKPDMEYNIKSLKERIKDGKRKESKVLQLIGRGVLAYGELKICSSDIGYVEIKAFSPPGKNEDQISMKNMFRFFEKCHSLIIDLRENNGGFTSLAAEFYSFFSSLSRTYFITQESFMRYDSNGTKKEISQKKEFYTDNQTTNTFISGKRIFILTSSRTFSAAELVIYKVKKLIPSVVVIGEPTKGGGNGYFISQANKYYTATIPSSNAFDKENNDYSIQNVGIIPDIHIDADSALYLAYKLVSEDKNINENGSEIKYYSKTKKTQESSLLKLHFKDYVGDYRKAVIMHKEGKLFLIYDNMKKCVLSPSLTDQFSLDCFESVRFIRDDIGKIFEIQILHKDGYLETFRKLSSD